MSARTRFWILDFGLWIALIQNPKSKIQNAAGLLANDWAIAVLVFVFTRLVALAGAYSGVSRLVQIDPSRNKGWLAELALMWDSAWYAGIARQGYTWHPGAAGGTNVAFAPLYPF